MTTATCQSRKGTISSWKAFAPAHAGKLGVEAVDRPCAARPPRRPSGRGRTRWRPGCWTAPPATGCRCRPRASPGGPSSTPSPRPTRPNTRPRPSSTWPSGCGRGRRHRRVERVVLHQRPHPQRHRDWGRRPREARPGGHPRDPGPLGHVHLRRRPPGRPLAPPGQLHPERAARPDTVRLWHRVETVEDLAWTARYHDPDLARRASAAGPRSTWPAARWSPASWPWPTPTPNGAALFARPDYRRKLATLADGWWPGPSWTGSPAWSSASASWPRTSWPA